MKKSFTQKGSTLIETLIYVSIFVILTASLSSFASTIRTSRLKNQINSEIHSQGSEVINLMTQSIRNAVSVNSPAISNASDSLSLETSASSTNPTIFSLATGTIFIKEGASALVALTNNKVKANSLTFTNLSKISTPGTIKIRFNLSNTDSNQTVSQQYNVDFYGSASLRK